MSLTRSSTSESSSLRTSTSLSLEERSSPSEDAISINGMKSNYTPVSIQSDDAVEFARLFIEPFFDYGFLKVTSYQ